MCVGGGGEMRGSLGESTVNTVVMAALAQLSQLPSLKYTRLWLGGFEEPKECTADGTGRQQIIQTATCTQPSVGAS